MKKPLWSPHLALISNPPWSKTRLNFGLGPTVIGRSKLSLAAFRPSTRSALMWVTANAVPPPSAISSASVEVTFA
jgi:hypothetical protein